MAVSVQDLYNWITVNWGGKANFGKGTVDPTVDPGVPFSIYLNETNDSIWFWNSTEWTEGAGGSGGSGGTYHDTVDNQTAMLAINSESINVGDWVERTDTGTAFWLFGEDPTQSANWKELPYPIQLSDTDDLSEGSVNLYFTDDRTFDIVRNALVNGSGISKGVNIPNKTITLDVVNHIPLSEKGVANGIATLDDNSKIPSSQLPAIAVTNAFEFANYSAMTGSSSAQEGDLGIVTDASDDANVADGGASYIYNGSAWIRLKVPTDVVTSVNGNTGVIQIDKPDVTLNVEIPTTNPVYITLNNKKPFELIEIDSNLLNGNLSVQFVKNSTNVGNPIVLDSQNANPTNEKLIEKSNGYFDITALGTGTGEIVIEIGSQSQVIAIDTSVQTTILDVINKVVADASFADYTLSENSPSVEIISNGYGSVYNREVQVTTTVSGMTIVDITNPLDNSTNKIEVNSGDSLKVDFSSISSDASLLTMTLIANYI
jgi:hypothetical protein